MPSPVPQVVVVDGGTGVRWHRPVHRQAGGAAVDRGHRGGRRPARRLLHVGNGDRHREGVGAAVVVVGLQRHRVARRRLVVVGDAGFRRELPGRRVEVERCRVGVLQGVGQRVVVPVGRRRQRRADVRVRRRVLGHLARGRSGGEFRGCVGDDRVGHAGRCQGEVAVADGVVDGVGGERHGERRGRVCQGRRQGEFDLGSSHARHRRRQVDAVGLDGDVAMTDRSDVLAEHQQHRLAVGRRRRRIGAGGDERRADAVDLVPGVDHDRGVGEVGGDGGAAGGVDRAAGELVRRDRDAVRGLLAHQHRVAARHRGRVRAGRAGGRFRGAVKVHLQLRGAGDVDRRVEGHRRLRPRRLWRRCCRIRGWRSGRPTRLPGGPGCRRPSALRANRVAHAPGGDVGPSNCRCGSFPYRSHLPTRTDWCRRVARERWRWSRDLQLAKK